jgi:cytoskeletal protein RodZ
MTARDQARTADRRLERERLEVPATAPSPRLGELLLEARERKGVDLYRAERDTKIRVKYLAALERGDFKELPGQVYTKGFLRNYALYLGLDPEAVLEQWKAEAGATRPAEPVIIAPRPLEAPRGGLTFTPGVFMAALLTLVIVAFAGYVGLQLMRFNQPPRLSITSPADVTSTLDASSLVLAGTSDPGDTVTILGPGGQTFRLTAGSDGSWQQTVPLAKGRNDFTITATDPATAHESAPQNVIVSVPVPQGPDSPTLTVTSPHDGTSFQNGAIPIQGTTNATSVVVSAAWAGPVASPRPGQATPKPPATPGPKQIAVDASGDFSDSYQLAPGAWDLTITATGAGDKTTTEQRVVRVAYTGVDVVVTVAPNQAAWLKVWVDGTVVSGYEVGQTVHGPKTLEFIGKSSVEVRTGNSGGTSFTVNGTALGALGKGGMPETWLFAPPAAPQKTNHT